MSGFTYTQYLTYLVNYLQQQDSNNTPSGIAAAFVEAEPNITANAEARIYRELDFLAQRVTNASLTFTAGSRSLNLANMTGGGQIIVVQGVAAIVPSSASTPATGTRVQFEMTTPDFIDYVWPTEATTAAPTATQPYFAMLSDAMLIVAPTPAGNYVAEITGIYRPPPLGQTTCTFNGTISSTTLTINSVTSGAVQLGQTIAGSGVTSGTKITAYGTGTGTTGTYTVDTSQSVGPVAMTASPQTTYLSTNYPDLMFAAAMVEATGWMRDYGQQADDPRLALSWEQNYQLHLKSAMEEAQRQKGSSTGWSSFSATEASPPRT